MTKPTTLSPANDVADGGRPLDLAWARSLDADNRRSAMAYGMICLPGSCRLIRVGPDAIAAIVAVENMAANDRGAFERQG